MKIIESVFLYPECRYVISMITAMIMITITITTVGNLITIVITTTLKRCNYYNLLRL